MKEESPTLSVIVPIYNEEVVIPELYRRLTSVLERIGESFEVICVNDGSRDNSLALLHDIHRRDARWKVISFARNFGHQAAITAGLDYARGQAVVIIDADLQDPPELIADLLAKWREGYEVVYAVRTEREGETWFKEFTAKLFYRLMHAITNVEIPIDTGDFRLMDRTVVETLRAMRERHRFMRGMAAWVGFRQIGVPYRRHARYAGETKYPLRKMLRFALDGITSFSYFPLQLATYFGFAIALLSVIFIVVVVAMRLSGLHAFEGQATTLIAVLFLGSIQLISLGILGEYIGRIYEESKGRPLYVVAQAWGLDRPMISLMPPHSHITDVSAWHDQTRHSTPDETDKIPEQNVLPNSRSNS
ncbi:glycosyltransferase family 2 protein [Ardenticatena maritima]|nr:glycosyltransferase family 2 protein [Ardenticatena maritima]